MGQSSFPFSLVAVPNINIAVAHSSRNGPSAAGSVVLRSNQSVQCGESVKRPAKGIPQHDSLDALAYGINLRKVNWILDADIRSFFDCISHEWMMRFLEHRIGDRRVLRLIAKWLKAGGMEEGSWTEGTIGTPHAPNAKGNFRRRMLPAPRAWIGSRYRSMARWRAGWSAG
jgi:hypothetical protein